MLGMMPALPPREACLFYPSCILKSCEGGLYKDHLLPQGMGPGKRIVKLIREAKEAQFGLSTNLLFSIQLYQKQSGHFEF